MNKKTCVFVISALCACLLSSCAQTPTGEPTWQEQYDLGVRYLSEGNYEEAIIAFTAAIEIDPKQALAYVGRGDAYIKSGATAENLSAAQTDYEVAIKLDETNVNAYLGLADVYIHLGEYDKAMDLMLEGLEIIGEIPSITEKRKELEDLLNKTDATPTESNEETYDFQTTMIEDGMDVDAEDLTVKIRNSRTATITVSGVSLQNSYHTNLSSSKENALEYGWEVRIYGTQESYAVSTSSWAFDPGLEKTVSLSDMQHSVWSLDEGSGSYIADAEMSHTADSITWTFTIPENYPFNFANVESYKVIIHDISRDLDLTRTYVIG